MRKAYDLEQVSEATGVSLVKLETYLEQKGIQEPTTMEEFYGVIEEVTGRFGK